ncbi:hypothetical protein D3C75_995040 [compost metagenome]
MPLGRHCRPSAQLPQQTVEGAQEQAAYPDMGTEQRSLQNASHRGCAEQKIRKCELDLHPAPFHLKQSSDQPSCKKSKHAGTRDSGKQDILPAAGQKDHGYTDQNQGQIARIHVHPPIY